MDEEALFAAALELPPTERRAFLDEACAGDARLRQRLELLLTADENTCDILDDSRNAVVPRACRPGPPLAAGQVFAGRFTLGRKLGEGGMGEVWVADQHEPVRRRVALKVIRPGAGSPGLFSRFEAERQALALMDHPNIAKVLDAGLAGGWPYFVMDLIEGAPITAYCDATRLSMRQRLELFIPVCQAVQHAHRKGVIHRDLKPSNILVALDDGQAVPKVIDFGVAKAIGQPLTERDVSTEVGTLVGTLEYMSPEQAELNNLDIDTRSDVYSLGVVLYELLTGTVPFPRGQLLAAPFTEMLRTIREAEPPAPSVRLSNPETTPGVAATRRSEPKKLATLVRGELDWIVMKCLEKDPARRYETANGLALDLRRYLDDEPVEACPPSAGYRLKKLLRRHRRPALAAGLVLLALLGGIVGTTIGLVRAERAKQTAEERLAQLEKGMEILGGIFEGIDPKAEEKGGPPLRAALGDQLAKAADELEREAAGDPLLVAGLQHRLGLSLLRLGMADRAIPLFAKSRATRAAALGPDHADTLTSMNNLARGYQDDGQLDRALRLFQETLELRRAALGDDHRDTLTSMNNLAAVYRAVGKTNLALPLLRETLRRRTATLGPDDPDTLRSMNNLAVGYWAVGKLDQALALQEEALRRTRIALGLSHTETIQSMMNLGSTYRELGRPDRALPLHEEALKARRATLSANHPDTLFSMSNLATTYEALRELEKSIRLHQETLELRKAKLGADHPDTLQSLCNLAVAYQTAGQLDKGLPLLQQTLQLRTAKLGPGHPDTLTSLNELAAGYWAGGKPDQALPLLQQAAAGLVKLQFAHRDTRAILSNLSECHERRSEYDQAEAWRRKCLAVVKEQRGAGSAQYAGELTKLAANLLKQKKYGESESLLREGLAICQNKQPKGTAKFQTQALLGEALLGQRKYAEAEPLLVQGYERMKNRERRPGGKPRVEAAERLARLYDGWGKPAEAARWRKELESLRNPAKE